MGVVERVGLLKDLEAARGHPVVTYITSPRPGASGAIAGDMVSELMSQLNVLPASTKQLDLLLVSNGGDPTVAWRIVTLIRERVAKFSVLVPQAAYSAATLIALGADEIVMHPNGNLGPTDTQIRRSGDKPISFGSEDLSAFLRFAREEVGITDQQQILSVFNHFCEEVGSVAVGAAARGAQLGVTMGEKLLQLHMPDGDRGKARAISQKLTRDFFHHGYPVSRTEAKAIGLPIAPPDKDIEALMWKLWLDVCEELALRSNASDLEFLMAEPACAPLFGAVPHMQAPVAQGAQPGPGQALAIVPPPQQMPLILVPPVPFKRTHALMESPRLAAKFVVEGQISAARMPDLNLKIAKFAHLQGWVSVDISRQSAVKTPLKESYMRARPTIAAAKAPKTAGKPLAKRGKATPQKGSK